MKYKTPQEAGIAAFVPPPKVDKRCAPRPNNYNENKRKYCITPKEAVAMGYKLPKLTT